MAEQDKKDLPEELPAPLLQFPCEFPMKVVGQRTDDFAQQIVAIIEKHAPDFNASEIEMKVSGKGNYLSLGFLVNATSQDMLDDLYRSLTAHPLVKFVLQKLIIRDLGKVDYLIGWQEMIDFTKKRDQTTEDEFWICEHPPVFTLGTSLKNSILPIKGIPCINTDRGGKITYHGPGQLVGYPLIDLRKNDLYPKELLELINQMVLSVMRKFGVKGLLVPEAPGIYVSKPGGVNQFFNLAKICSIGLKISNHCSYHGFALNVSANLEPFSYINPCGYEGLRVANLNEFAKNATLESTKRVLVEIIKEQFSEKRN